MIKTLKTFRPAIKVPSLLLRSKRFENYFDFIELYCLIDNFIPVQKIILFRCPELSFKETTNFDWVFHWSEKSE